MDNNSLLTKKFDNMILKIRNFLLSYFITKVAYMKDFFVKGDDEKMAKINKKLLRVLDEIQKAEEKLAQWQKYLEELNIRKEQLEDQEIIKSIRSVKLESRELLSVLSDIQDGAIVLPMDKGAQESVSEDGEPEGTDISEGKDIPEENVADTSGILDEEIVEKEIIENESKN